MMDDSQIDGFDSPSDIVRRCIIIMCKHPTDAFRHCVLEISHVEIILIISCIINFY